MIPVGAIADRYRGGVTTKKDSASEQPQAVVIRMPRELHEAIKAKAAKEERSMAQAMRYALRQYAET